MTNLLTFVYLACFQACALPSIVRVIRRGSSGDLSIWREVLLLVGVSTQFSVMWLTAADWRVLVSPVLSGCGVLVLLITIWRHR